MLVQLRPSIWLASLDELKIENVDKFDQAKINRVVIVCSDDFSVKIPGSDMVVFQCPLRADRVNPAHIKDLACHIPKTMVQNGDRVLIVSKTGKGRGAYIAARAICELEGKGIYDVFMEMQELIENFDIGQAYF